MSNGKIIGAVQDSIAIRQKENQEAEAKAYAEIQILQQHNSLKEATVSGREALRNFSEEISTYSVDSLLPGLAVKIKQGQLAQFLLPDVMGQLAGYAILGAVCAKAIKAVELECCTQPESDLRNFEKINFEVLRKHKAI